MKIIYIANARIPTEKAHGIQIMKMCEAFAFHNDVEVELVVPRRFNKIKKDPFEYYGVEKNFKIKKLPHLDFIPLDILLGPLASWLSFLEFSLISFCYFLIKGLLFKPETIFFSRDHFPLFFLSFLSCRIFYEVHDFPCLKSRFHKLYYQTFLKRLEGIITTNLWKKRELERIFGLDSERILVFPNGIDFAEYDIKEGQKECREKLRLPLNKKIVLYTGHLYEWKGVQILAEASQHLSDDIEVYFVGGTAEDVKKFKIKNSKLKINVVGHRPHVEIPFWLKAVDVLVLPNSAKESISKYWTSPMKMFEYMASGRPIVASDLPSIREILNEENAILVEPDNVQALAQGIKEVLQNTQLSDKISQKALQDVQNYTWQKRAEKILRFVQLFYD